MRALLGLETQNDNHHKECDLLLSPEATDNFSQDSRLSEGRAFDILMEGLHKKALLLKHAAMCDNLTKSAFLFPQLREKLHEHKVHGKWRIQMAFPWSPACLQAATFFGHKQHVLKECQLIPVFVQAEQGR